MKGSAKQIKWAEDIKRGALDAIEVMKSTRQHYDEIDWKRNSNLYDITWEAIEAIAAEYTAVLNDPRLDNLDASVLIDQRAKFSAEAIHRHALEWMRYHN